MHETETSVSLSSLEWLLLTTLIIVVIWASRRELHYHAACQERDSARAEAALSIALLFDAAHELVTNGPLLKTIDVAKPRGPASSDGAAMQAEERACESHQQ